MAEKKKTTQTVTFRDGGAGKQENDMTEQEKTVVKKDVGTTGKKTEKPADGQGA